MSEKNSTVIAREILAEKFAYWQPKTGGNVPASTELVMSECIVELAMALTARLSRPEDYAQAMFQIKRQEAQIGHLTTALGEKQGEVEATQVEATTLRLELDDAKARLAALLGGGGGTHASTTDQPVPENQSPAQE